MKTIALSVLVFRGLQAQWAHEGANAMPPNRSEAKGSAIDINNLILTVLAIVRVDLQNNGTMILTKVPAGERAL